MSSPHRLHTVRPNSGLNLDPGHTLPAGRGAGLLMTATLVPPPSAVSRADPAARLADYLDALAFYLSLPNATLDRVLFVDNSDADIGPVVDAAQRLAGDKTVEVLSFQGNDHPPQRGKAYGEFRLMDYGLAHSTLFAPDDVVWKVTGRLKCLNLPALAGAAARRPFDVQCDLHNLPWVGGGRWRNNRHMDLRLFAFRRAAYDAVFRDTWRERERGFDARFLYGRVMAARGTLRVRPRFPLQPRLQGISGRHLRDYNAGGQRLKDDVRGALRRVAPWLWL